MAVKLAQLKIDVKNSGWPWPIDHPNDERALLDGCRPDFAAAERVREFYHDLLTLPKIGGGVRPFVLLDWWYRDVIAPLFGWKRHDGRRRYDKGFITTAKKSGKSSVLAGLPAYMLTADGEEAAECYATGVDKDQAKIIYDKCSKAVKDSPELSSILTRVDSRNRIVHHGSGSFFEALAADAPGVEGKNPHLLLCDEVHVWRDKRFFEALMYGDISRQQPMFLMITTAGEDTETVGYEEYQFAKDLLDPNTGTFSPSHFAFIAEADKRLAWDNPKGWRQANPSIDEGIVALDKLQAKCDEAKVSPKKQRSFERYIANRWVPEVDDPWIDMDQWNACGGEIEDHTGDHCACGLDLSKVADLTAICAAFWSKDIPGTIDLEWLFWLPKGRIKELADRDKNPYPYWVDEGWIKTTEGNTIRYSDVRKWISGAMLDETGSKIDGEPFPESLAARYAISEIAYDKYNAQKLVEEELGQYDGIPVVEHSQGYLAMSGACKEFERRVRDGTIRHGDNPVAAWMARHTICDEDAMGNIKINKKKSRQKIDGIVAAVMAVGRLVLGEVAAIPGEYYLEHDVEFS